jgi:uncharacterized membrane protein
MNLLTRQRRIFLDLLPVRPRLYISALSGVGIGVLVPGRFGLPARLLIGWDAGILIYLILIAVLLGRATRTRLEQQAIRHRQGRWWITSLILAAAMAALVAITQLMVGAKEAGGLQALHIALAGITIIASWLLVHAVFAQIYAHDYFGPVTGAAAEPPLDFPGEEEPDFSDFLYFSMVIGMTCQVSDVAIRGRALRRIALLHGILSFFFNTIVLALTVNIAASLL